MKKILLTLVLFISFIHADITKVFPELSGRVVDEANLLGSISQKKLSDILQKHEEETSNQIVVVILKSLDGYEIADYSYQLGRHWGIGQKDKNNGVLLVIATEDRKLRIEVGYGLEGALTDKISHEIIEYTLKPKFRIEQYEKGIFQAVDKIILAIKGEYKNDGPSKREEASMALPLLLFASLFFAAILQGIGKSIKSQKTARIATAMIPSGFSGFFAYAFTESNLFTFIIYGIFFAVVFITTKKIDFTKRSYRNSSSSSYGGFSSGGGFSSSSSGGFSGGGGSFGGGGASGGW